MECLHCKFKSNVIFFMYTCKNCIKYFSHWRCIFWTNLSFAFEYIHKTQQFSSIYTRESLRHLRKKMKRVGLNLRMQFVNANFCLMYGNWRVIWNFFWITFYGLFSIWDKYLLVIIFCKKKIVKEGWRASDNPQMLKLVFLLNFQRDKI